MLLSFGYTLQPLGICPTVNKRSSSSASPDKGEEPTVVARSTVSKPLSNLIRLRIVRRSFSPEQKVSYEPEIMASSKPLTDLTRAHPATISRPTMKM